MFKALVAVPLGEAAAVTGQQQRQMVKLRGAQAQLAVKPELARRAGQKITAAHDLVDPHQGIVHNDRQLVGKHAVRPAQVKIPAVPGQILGAGAHVAVLKGDDLIGYPHPPGGGAGLGALGDLSRRQAAAGPGVDDLTVAAVGRTGGVKLAAAAKAGVDQPAAGKLLKILRIDGTALALVDRRLGAVGGKAQPRQIIYDGVRIAARAALGVQILYAQQNLPALAFGAQPGEQAAHQVAQVHPPAGAGCVASGRHSSV